jgi:MFS family permease
MADKETETPVAPAQQRSGSVELATTSDVTRIEAPVTWKAYLICAFAAFGGIFFGYDSGYINGVLGSAIFIREVEGPGRDTADGLTSSNTSLVTSILSCGTFFGALISGDVADMIGRKWTVIIGCGIYMFGVVIQMLTGPEIGSSLGAIVAGRLIAGIGVGFESAVVILYMSEIVSASPTRRRRLLLTRSAVPSQSPWRAGRWLPILHHHRYPTRLRRRLCHQRPH